MADMAIILSQGKQGGHGPRRKFRDIQLNLAGKLPGKEICKIAKDAFGSDVIRATVQWPDFKGDKSGIFENWSAGENAFLEGKFEIEPVKLKAALLEILMAIGSAEKIEKANKEIAQPTIKLWSKNSLLIDAKVVIGNRSLAAAIESIRAAAYDAGIVCDVSTTPVSIFGAGLGCSTILVQLEFIGANAPDASGDWIGALTRETEIRINNAEGSLNSERKPELNRVQMGQLAWLLVYARQYMGVHRMELSNPMFEGNRIVLKAFCDDKENYMNDRGMPDRVKIAQLHEKLAYTNCTIRPKDKNDKSGFWFDLLIPCKSQPLLPGQASP